MQTANQISNQEPEFQVEGTLVSSAEFRHPNGTKQVKRSRSFVVARKGQQWKIRTSDLNDSAIEYEETGCDGRMIYDLRQMNEAQLRQELGELPSDCFTTQGWVRHGKFPANLDTDFFFPLWLAFCSSDYFILRKDGRIVSPELPEGDNNSRKAKPAKWQLNESSLPSKVEWYSEGKDYAYPPPFDGVYLSDSFEVASWNEFSGLHLPRSFEVKQYFPNHLLANPDPAQGELYLAGVIEAHVKSIQPLSGFSCFPELTRKTLMTDGRFRGGCCPDGLLSYGSSVWMTEEEVEAKNKQFGVKCEKQIP